MTKIPMRMEWVREVGNGECPGFSPSLHHAHGVFGEVEITDGESEDGNQGKAQVHHGMDDAKMLGMMAQN
ncbi:MAG: hypothetical protein DYH03_08240 [Nitrospira sp. NTP1]|nr:hypothetical protein [Nitrospira sp. NTP1]